jgi:hypothetical protein
MLLVEQDDFSVLDVRSHLFQEFVRDEEVLFGDTLAFYMILCYAY